MKNLIDYIQQGINEDEQIADFNATVTITVKLDKTYHADERQMRHGKRMGEVISDEVIVADVKKASKDIIKSIINNDIDVYGKRSRFIVRNKDTKLNIVCQAHKTDNPNIIEITVVTVIRVNKFWNTKDNFTIVI